MSIILNPVRSLQGIGAAEEIAQAIKEFNQYKEVDVFDSRKRRRKLREDLLGI